MLSLISSILQMRRSRFTWLISLPEITEPLSCSMRLKSMCVSLFHFADGLLISLMDWHDIMPPLCSWNRESGERSIVQLLSHVWLCDPMNCSTLDFPVLHSLPESAQTHVHWLSDAIQSSHPLSPHSPLALCHPIHIFPSIYGLFQEVGSLHQVAKVLELQHQSFQWIFRVDFL